MRKPKERGGHDDHSDVGYVAGIAGPRRRLCISADDSRSHAAPTVGLTMADLPGSGERPIRYELRLLGHLDPHWSNWFTGLTLAQNQDGTTSLCGTLADQAELHGPTRQSPRPRRTPALSHVSHESAILPETEDTGNRGNHATAEPAELGQPCEPETALEAEAARSTRPPPTHPGE